MPVESSPVGSSPADRALGHRPVAPNDPDATVVIADRTPGPDVVVDPVAPDRAGPPVPGPSAPPATPGPDEFAEPGVSSAAAVLDGDRSSRRERRQAGDTAGSRPASEYKEQADALAQKARKRPRTGRRRRPAFWRELPLLVVVALLLTFLIQTFLAKVYVIPSGSMELTLHGCTGCNNDRVLVDKVKYRFTDPQQGDVVVFRGPDSWSSEVTVTPPANAVVATLQQLGSLIGIAPPDEKDFVKRIIAVGGQTVQCCDSRNRVLVDDQPIDEPYIYYLPDVGPPRQDSFGPITVPPGQLWMMGDSRNNSSDSRAAGHGPVPVENVIGKAQLIVLPIGRFGWIESVDLQRTAVGMAPPGSGPPLALGLMLTVPLLRRRRWSDARADREPFDRFLPGRRRWR